jgi:hypothetical protein
MDKNQTQAKKPRVLVLAATNICEGLLKDPDLCDKISVHGAPDLRTVYEHIGTQYFDAVMIHTHFDGKNGDGMSPELPHPVAVEMIAAVKERHEGPVFAFGRRSVDTCKMIASGCHVAGGEDDGVCIARILRRNLCGDY